MCFPKKGEKKYHPSHGKWIWVYKSQSMHLFLVLHETARIPELSMFLRQGKFDYVWSTDISMVIKAIRPIHIHSLVFKWYTLSYIKFNFVSYSKTTSLTLSLEA